MNLRARGFWIAAAFLLGALALLLLIINRGRRDVAVASPPASAAKTTPAPAPGAPPAPGPAPAPSVDAAPMPEGLTQDLAIFNSDQLRAELESIALSYPAVVLLSVACDARPCTAEVQVEPEGGDQDDEIEALNTFLDMVSKRFQGYLTATFREVTTRSGGRAVRAVLFVGGPAPHPAPRYP